jgi:Ca2+-binding RTX toxin-like protein
VKSGSLAGSKGAGDCRAVVATLVLGLLILVAVSPAAANQAARVALSLQHGHLGEGASASVGSNLIQFTGTAGADHLVVFVDTTTGELVILDSAGQTPPGGSCTPAPPTPVTEVRCPPNYIGAIVGSLLGGNDSLRAAPSVQVFFGAAVNGQPRPFTGGNGSDLLFGGALGDGLFGGAGVDRLAGRGGADLLNGGASADRLAGGPGGDVLSGGRGADRLAGGIGPDFLFAGNGRDTLDGGGGRDHCAGGGGTDRAKGCELFRTIP